MQTHFTEAQLADPLIRERRCHFAHMCALWVFTATCPTFVMTGDERDSPRGRIWMLREVLERPESASKDTSYHIDRCLGCLSCTSTCPSGLIMPIFWTLVVKSLIVWCRAKPQTS